MECEPFRHQHGPSHEKCHQSPGFVVVVAVAGKLHDKDAAVEPSLCHGEQDAATVALFFAIMVKQNNKQQALLRERTSKSTIKARKKQ